MYLNKELFSVGTQSKDVIQKMPTEKTQNIIQILLCQGQLPKEQDCSK